MLCLNIFSKFKKTVLEPYSHRSKFYIGSGILCGIVSAEMAILTIGGVFLKSNVTALSANMAGALLYGICACNLIPYTPILGATIFTGYSLIHVDDKSTYYLTTKLFNGIIRNIVDYVIIPTWAHVVVPVFNHAIYPTCQMITQIFATVFNKISLPENPAWYVVTLLVIAIAIRMIVRHFSHSTERTKEIGIQTSSA